jgi:phosphoribosyl 1,2-cyclic phosphodiesterase
MASARTSRSRSRGRNSTAPPPRRRPTRATDLGQRPGSLSAGPGPALNLTARETAEAAAAARARRLLLTHFWPDNDRRAALAAASAAFPGEIMLADEGLSVPLG